MFWKVFFFLNKHFKLKFMREPNLILIKFLWHGGGVKRHIVCREKEEKERINMSFHIKEKRQNCT